mgnify:CR=1 FL=1
MLMINLLQESNIGIFLRSMPADIQGNISACTEKWLMGETTHGYPHPAQVCANLQATHERQPFLTVQQAINLQVLKNHLRLAI